MKTTVTFCLIALLIACAVSQEPDIADDENTIYPWDTAPSEDNLDADEAPSANNLRSVDQPQNQTLNQSQQTQDFHNVCCANCSRYSGATRLRCYDQCSRVCYGENQCLNAGHGVYAGWCQGRCTSNLASSQQPLTPRQCAGACSQEVQTLCRNRCNDLYSGCNADESQCLSEASRNCNVS